MVASIPVSGMSVRPVSAGAYIAAAVAIAQSSSRVVSLGDINAESLFCGVRLSWTDDFDSVSQPTELISWQPMVQPLPIPLLSWYPEAMGFGLEGYKTIWKMIVAYKSTAAITLAITAYDGTSPSNVTLPSTSGAYRKTVFTLSPNKGMLFKLSATSSAQWTPYFDEWEIHVGKWGRQEPCTVFRNLTQVMGEGNG